MSNLCVSLELAKKMKELGWEKPTRFEGDVNGRMWNGYAAKEVSEDEWESYCFPTAQEILDELPKYIENTVIKEILINLVICPAKDGRGSGRCASYSTEEDGVCFSELFMNESVAEALGQLWCWCKEKGYLPKGINSPSP